LPVPGIIPIFFAVNPLNDILKEEKFSGHSNEDVAKQCNILFIVLPYDYLASTIKDLVPHLSEKTILVDSIVPLTFTKGIVKYKENLPYNSASEHLQAILPDEHIVVGAFKTVSAAILNHISDPMNVDVFVTSDDKDAKKEIITLLSDIKGLRALDAGPLFMSKTIEQMTALVINLNKLNGLSHASFKIVESNE
jgi:hypothetical protein